MASPALSAEGTAWRTPVGTGLWGDAWRQFRRHRLALVGLLIVGLLVVLAVLAPVLVTFGLLSDPYELDAASANAGVTGAHPLGADHLGRDLLSRTIHGARVSLSIGILVQVPILVVGGTIGLVAGYAGGRLDTVLMRFTDVMFAFPDLLFVLVVASVLGPGYWSIFLAMAAVNWVFLARLVRGEVLWIKEKEYMHAARASGTPPHRAILKHVVPNALGPVIVTLSFGVPAAIFLEAFLSFLGVGMRPPTPSWGVMINEGYQAVFAYPHQVLAPALAISLTTLAFHFIGDGLRDALDPGRGGAA